MEAILPMTPDAKRLQTFFTSPIPNEYDLSVSNSPIKFSEAGFIRTKNSREDEVECISCGVKYKGWSGESPLAVHRTLNPNCNFLNTPPDTITTENTTNPELQCRINELENVRRQLFPTSDGPMSIILNVPDIKQPFCPKRGGYLMLFESHRLLTFVRDVHSADAAMYAKAGFMYERKSQTVVCIFCNAEFAYQSTNMIQLETWHLEKSQMCPFIHSFDVGNVSMDTESKIHEKVRAQFFRDALEDKLSCSRVKYLIKRPEFEDEVKRVGTFTSWPKFLASVLPPTVMSAAGLFYTGSSDKVECFACGVGLYDWSPEAVPAEQHAKASPECYFLTQSKGQEFIDAAQNVQLIVQADHVSTISESQEQDAASSATDSGVSSASSSTAATPLPGSPLTSPGFPVLDLEAIKAATACQYTIEQIVHAITKFFVLSCGQYPNADLLLGTLKAADENHKQICEAKQEIIQKDALYQAEKAAYQQEIQATRSELQRTAFELQWRDLEVRTELEQMLQQKDQVIEQKDQMLEQNYQVIEQKDHVIEQNYQALEHKDMQLEMKTKEVEDLQRHIRSLMAELDRRQGSSGSDDEESSSSSSSDLEHSSESESSESSESQAEEFPIASCKVCMVKASQIVFLPCKHLCCCDSCAARLRGKNCPICRERNLGFEKVYVI